MTRLKNFRRNENGDAFVIVVFIILGLAAVFVLAAAIFVLVMAAQSFNKIKENDQIISSINSQVTEQAEDVDAKVFGLEDLNFYDSEFFVTVRTEDSVILDGRILVTEGDATLYVEDEATTDWVRITDLEE